MKHYTFHWRDGSTSEGWGTDAADALARLGYSEEDFARVERYQERVLVQDSVVREDGGARRIQEADAL